MTRPNMLKGLLSFGSMTMVSRIFGLVRDIVISSVFGVSPATDAFWVAFRIPNFMRRLFAEGSFTTAFVPVFTQIKETRPHSDLKTLVSRTAGTLGGVPFLMFVSLTALAGGALNSFHRFGLPALAPVILNICMIAAALWLAPRLQTP